MKVTLKVKPNSSNNKIIRWGPDYKVNVKAVADKGKANKELVKFLKKKLKKKVRILSGFKSRTKTLEIS